MTAKNNINLDQLYNLIINSSDKHQTFIDNLELWKYFYSNRDAIIKDNLLNPSLFTIIKFLLEQEKGEIFQYFHSDLIETLEEAQENLTFKLRDSQEKSTTDIDKLFNNLKFHDDIVAFLSTLQIEDVFCDIKKYSNRILELYTVDSLIIILYNQFFSLEPDVVKKLVDFITKKSVSLQNSKVKNNNMNTDLIFQYLTKIFPIKKFIGQELVDDELINQIKTYQIKDKNLLVKIFKELSVETILEIFEEDINILLTFLTDADYLAEADKFAIVCYFFDKMLKEKKYIELLELIVKNNQNPLWEKYLNSNVNIYNQIIIGGLNTPIFYMDSDMIKYLLTAELNQSKRVSYEDTMEHTIAQSNFRFECQYLMRKKDFLEPSFDIEGISNIISSLSPKTFTNEELEIIPNDSFSQKEAKIMKRLSVGLDIDFNTAIDLLGKHFENKNRLSIFSVQAIIRSIATEFQKQLGIENNGIYYNKEKGKNGAFYPGYLAISINRNLARKFSNYRLPVHERLRIFITMFHEIKHAKINQNKKNNILDIDAYEMEKEHIVRAYDANFYDSNYKKIKEEISARISGYDSLLKFIEAYFPQYLDLVQDEIIKELEIEKALDKEQNSERIMQFFKEQQIQFNIGFDTLIKYNPTIIIEHPILNLEYYPNGTPKTYEDIWLSRTEENKDLIDGILMRRYPSQTNPTLNSGHTK